MSKLLTAEALAALWEVAPSTILKWVDLRGLPCVRLSARTIRFSLEDVDAWLAAQPGRGPLLRTGQPLPPHEGGQP